MPLGYVADEHVFEQVGDLAAEAGRADPEVRRHVGEHVHAGRDDDVEAGALDDALDPGHVSPEPDHGQVDDRVDAGGLQRDQLLARLSAVAFLVPHPGHVRRDFGIEDDYVLMHQGDAERRDIDWAQHCFHGRHVSHTMGCPRPTAMASFPEYVFVHISRATWIVTIAAAGGSADRSRPCRVDSIAHLGSSPVQQDPLVGRADREHPRRSRRRSAFDVAQGDHQPLLDGQLGNGGASDVDEVGVEPVAGVVGLDERIDVLDRDGAVLTHGQRAGPVDADLK